MAFSRHLHSSACIRRLAKEQSGFWCPTGIRAWPFSQRKSHTPISRTLKGDRDGFVWTPECKHLCLSPFSVHVNIKTFPMQWYLLNLILVLESLRERLGLSCWKTGEMSRCSFGRAVNSVYWEGGSIYPYWWFLEGETSASCLFGRVCCPLVGMWYHLRVS